MREKVPAGFLRADQRPDVLIGEHVFRRCLVVPPTGDVELRRIEPPRESRGARRLFAQKQIGRVLNLVEEREALVGIDSGVIRATEPRALASLDDRNLAVSPEKFGGDGVGDDAADFFEVRPIHFGVGERIHKARLDQDRWHVGIVQEEEIVALFRATIDKSARVRDQCGHVFGELVLSRIEHFAAHRILGFDIGVEVNRDIEIAIAPVVVHHDALEVFLLRRAHIVMKGFDADAEHAQISRDIVDHPARLIDLVDVAARAAHVFAVAAGNDGVHGVRAFQPIGNASQA